MNGAFRLRRVPQRPMPDSSRVRRKRGFFRGTFRRGSFWKRALWVVAGGLVLASLAVVGIIVWASQSLPDPNNLSFRIVAQSTKIYARDGKTLLYEIHGDVKRTVVNLPDVSPDVVHAVISIEDKDFYKHAGISIRGILRSVFVDIVSGKKSQGGSTLTQQLVKNTILTRDKSFIRKLKEIILSYQLEHVYSKDQILKLYFNEIPWGSTSYGVEAASQTYFGVHAKDLTLSESSLLAAMVQLPSYYSPRGTHTDALLNRQHLVLDSMVANGYVTQAQADAARADDVLAKVTPFQDPIIAPHFVFYVRDLLVQKYGEQTVEQGGLRVVTTLDPKMQQIAEEEVTKGAAINDKRGASNAAMVALDPTNGQILAMVGSRDFFDTKHDGNFNVITSVRNPGSSFKPIVYMSAFLKGYSPDTLMFDLKTDFGPDGSGKDYIPNNYDFKEHGPLKMRQTLDGSLNIPAVKTLYLAGIQSTVDLGGKLGYSTLTGQTYGLALAIGGAGVEPLEHADAFAVIANDGKRNPTTPFLLVEDTNGKTLEKFQKNEQQVVDKNVIRQLDDVLSDNSARAFVFGAKNYLTLGSRPVGAKTGTTNDFKDAWTVGFTPQLVAAVWVGNNDFSSMGKGADGSVVAAPIWNGFMKRALDGQPVKAFPRPTSVTESKPVLQGKLPTPQRVAVDKVTGKHIPDSCLSSWPAAFVKYITVNEVHDILYYLNKDDPNGSTPSNPASDPMFNRWDAPVQAWAKKNGYVGTMPADESCSLRASTSSATLAFSAPGAGATIKSSSLTASVVGSNMTDPLSVTFTLDGVSVGSVTAAPYETTIDLSGVDNGFHTIIASATDANGISATATVSINTLVQQNTTVYFVSPAPNSSISAGSFPQLVQAYAYDPAGISLLSLYADNPDGTTSLINQVSAPADASVSLSWPSTNTGKYKLYLVATTKKGKTAQSDKLTVTVN